MTFENSKNYFYSFISATLICGSFLLAPSASFADENKCPDLRGRFTCETQYGNSLITVDLEDKDGVPTYTIDDGIGPYLFPADGIVYPNDNEEINQTGSIKTICSTDRLIIFNKGQLTRVDGSIYQNWDFEQTLLKTKDGMEISTTGTHFLNGETKKLEDSRPYQCKKIIQ